MSGSSGCKVLLKLSRTEYYKSSMFLPANSTAVTSYNIVVGDRIQAPEQLAEAVQSSLPLPEPIVDPPLMDWHSAATVSEQRAG